VPATIPFAHAGHWALYLLYAVPIGVVLASVLVTVRRERRREDSEVSPPPEP
jgi:cytochrome c-type biogenesis protein CcmH/NrfF